MATAKGLQMYGEHIQAVRDAIGWDQPLAADHFGPLDVNDAIRHARYFETVRTGLGRGSAAGGHARFRRRPEELARVQGDQGIHRHADQHRREPVRPGGRIPPLIENNAVDMIHCDPLTSGGIRETKRISDFASMYGIPTAVHFAGSPVGCMASVHMIATIKDFVAMENHAVDIPWWGDLVTGRPSRLSRTATSRCPTRRVSAWN